MHNKKIVILGTGGTIAGTASSPSNNIDYAAAQVDVSQLLASIDGLVANVQTEQVAQIDSKDMSFDVWTALAERVDHHLSQDDVQGLVITHGTDTLEETAFFLHSVLSPVKPVVLTCAMRPASSLAPDGPQNILDAIAVAGHAGAHGVVAVCGGAIHGALDVQKTHPYQLNAFGSGDAGVLGYVEEGGLRLLRIWPTGPVSIGTDATEKITRLSRLDAWPRVEIVMNYAGVSGDLVDALVAQGVRGLVVAGTGNGTVHWSLHNALVKAQARGVQVIRSTRCTQGRVLARSDDTFPTSDGLSPVKARIGLLLKLMGVMA